MGGVNSSTIPAESREASGKHRRVFSRAWRRGVCYHRRLGQPSHVAEDHPLRQRSTWCAAFLMPAVLGPVKAQYGDISDLKLNKPEDKEDVKGTPPPQGAIVLFNGKTMDGWVKRDGTSKPEWKLLENGVGEVKGGDIISEQKFDGAFKLHVEFRVPYMPEAKGQARGNSGVY